MDVNKLIFEMLKNNRPISLGKLHNKCDKLGASYTIITNMLIDYQQKTFGNYYAMGAGFMYGEESRKKNRRILSPKTVKSTTKYMREYHNEKKIVNRMEKNGS